MKNLSTWITIGIFAIGIIAGWGRLQAQTSMTQDKVYKLEAKTETLAEKVATVETKQENIKEKVDKIDDKTDKILELMIQKKGGK